MKYYFYLIYFFYLNFLFTISYNIMGAPTAFYHLVDIQEASRWATDFLCKEVSPSNISYLIQY